MAAIGSFKSPTSGNAVTWDESGAHTDTGIPYSQYTLPTAPAKNANQLGFAGVSMDAATQARRDDYQSGGKTYQDEQAQIAADRAEVARIRAQMPGMQTLAGRDAMPSVLLGGTPTSPTSASNVIGSFKSPTSGNWVTYDSSGQHTDTGQSASTTPNPWALAPPTMAAPQAGPLTTAAGVVQPGQSTGQAQQQPQMSWGGGSQQQQPAFNTPVLNALYQSQQQRMTAPAPTFNFQATAPNVGALTQAIQGI